MAMIEAMSMGLPCVVPDVGNISDLAEDGVNAFVVKPSDVEAYASRILTLLRDETLRKKFSENAMKTMQKKEKEFSFPYIRDQWKAILQ